MIPRGARALALVLLATAPAGVQAQSEPAAPAVGPQDTLVPAPPTQAEDKPPAPALEPDATAAAEPTAEALYHGAFDALARGERELAISLLRELQRWPGPLAVRAREVLATLAASEIPDAAPRAATAAPEATAGERTTGAARAELVFFQTLHGLALGAETCTMLQCEGSQPWVLSIMLGAGAGFGATWALSSDGVTPGFARATTDGVLWGAANGGALIVATGVTDNNADEEVAVGAFLATGQLLGLGLSALTYSELRPTAGQASMTASGGIWTLVVTAEFVAMFEPNIDDRTWAWLLLGAGNLGVLAGGYFASTDPMSASRVLLIDAGGLLGTLTGLGLAVLVQGDSSQVAPTFGAGLAGTLVGLGLSYHLTSGWDEDDAQSAYAPRLALAPLPGGAQASFALRW